MPEKRESGRIRARFTAVLGGPPPEAPGGIRFRAGSVLSPYQTIGENVMLGREPQTFGFVRTHELHRRAAGLLERVGLAVDPEHPVAELDAIGRRLVELARALGVAEDAGEHAMVLIDQRRSELSGSENERWIAALDTVSQYLPVQVAVASLRGFTHRVERVVVVRDGGVVGDAAPDDHVEIMRMLRGDGPEPERRPRSRVWEGEKRPAAPVRLTVSGLVVMHPVTPERRAFDGIEFVAKGGDVTGIAGVRGIELLMSLFGGAYGTVAGGEVAVDGRAVKATSRDAAIENGIVFTTEHPPLYDVDLIGGIPSSVSAERLGSLARSGMIDRRRDYVPREVPSVLSAIPGVHKTPTRREFNELLDSFVSGNARVVLLAEPLRGCDAAERAARIEVIGRMADAGKSVVVAASDPRDLVALCDDVLVLGHDGISTTISRDDVTVERILQEVTWR